MYDAFKNDGIFKKIHEAKYVSLLIKDNELLKKHKQIRDKISYNTEKEFDSEQIHSGKYIETKVKSHNGNINIDFHDNGMPKDDSSSIYFYIILIDSVFKMRKNYYPQVFLEECKYTVKEKSRYISDDSKNFSDDSDEEASDKSHESDVPDKEASNKGGRYYTCNTQKRVPDESDLISELRRGLLPRQKTSIKFTYLPN